MVLHNINWPNSYLLFFNRWWNYIHITESRTINQLEIHILIILHGPFNITSSFTNILFIKTIQISADTLHGSELIPPNLSKTIFIKLIYMTTELVEFSFNTIMHQTIDDVAMGSPLVQYWITYLYVSTKQNCLKLLGNNFVFRYVDDAFAIFNNECKCSQYLHKLNSLHPLLNSTLEKKSNNQLPFLDVLVEKN